MAFYRGKIRRETVISGQIDGAEQSELETILPDTEPDSLRINRSAAERREEPSYPTSGRVVEDSTGLPIEGATIEMAFVSWMERVE